MVISSIRYATGQCLTMLQRETQQCVLFVLHTYHGLLRYFGMMP